MSVSTGLSLSLAGFTAYELPTSKWLKLVHPKMRLRVRARNRDFVSSTVKVRDRSPDGSNVSSIHWPWSDDELRPSLADDEIFEVEVERRFLISYQCIRRTKPVSIDQIRTGDDHCALSLYDGQRSSEVHDNGIEIGEITFRVRGDATTGGASSEGNASPTAY